MGLNYTFKSNLELPLFWFNSMSYNDRLMQAADTRSLDRRWIDAAVHRISNANLFWGFLVHKTSA